MFSLIILLITLVLLIVFKILTSFRLLILLVLLCVIWSILPEVTKFNLIKKINLWVSFESRSGVGSEDKNTQVIQKILPRIIQKYNIKTMLDCPCGDMNYMSKILPSVNINYMGADIVNDLIVDNKQKYPNYKFMQFDVVNQKLSTYDLIVMKDLLNHLSINNINKIISNIKNSGSTYLLLNNNKQETNGNSVLTAPFWNNINWKIDPWNLNVVEEFNSDGNDKDYVLVSINS